MDKTRNTENHQRYSQLQYTKNNPDLTSMKTIATTAEYILFKHIWNMSRIDHFLDHEKSLKLKSTEIVQSMFFYQNEIELEINNRRKFGKSTTS